MEGEKEIEGNTETGSDSATMTKYQGWISL